MEAYKITEELKAKIEGKKYNDGMIFNPIKDINGDWFISIEEVEGNTNSRYKDDLKGLNLSEFIPPVYDEFF